MPSQHDIAWAVADPARRQKFFLEWRIELDAVCEELTRAQDLLERHSDGHFQVLQSCASNNLHVTLNELNLDSPRQVVRVLELLNDFNTTRAPCILAGAPVAELCGVGNFDERVFFVPLQGSGLLALQQLFTELCDLLDANGVDVEQTKERGLTAHITLGKLKPKSGRPEAVLRAIEASGLESRDFGHVPVREVVFCVKRRKDENTPPVLMRLPGGVASRGPRRC